MSTDTPTHRFDQAWQRERPARAFEDLFDPASRRQLAERGIRPGWPLRGLHDA